MLLEEGNVTRAGQRLELSQPAMSAALARLRRRFDDELLVRAGRDYELTPFARDLLPEVQHAVRLMQRALHLEDEFDPATSDRTFRMAMSDYAIAVVHEPLRAADAGGGSRRTAGDREPRPGRPRSSDRVLLDHDALIAPLGFGFPGESRPLWRDRMVLIADRGNPGSATAASRLEDLAALAARRAQLRAGHPDPGRPRLRRARHRAARRAAGGGLPAAAVRHRGHRHGRRRARDAWPACTCAPTARSCMVEPPFDEVVLAEGYWFASDRLSDPAHRWLFARLDELAELQELATDG